MKRRDFLRSTMVGGAAFSFGALNLAGLARAKETGVLKFVPQADLAVLDPLMTAAFVTRNHAHLVYDQLYGVDEEFAVKPQMAEGHVVENDGLLWRITLRDGLKFHDGEPVRATDAAASLTRWMQRDSWGKELVPIVAEMSAASDRELLIRLHKPYRLLADAFGKPGGSMPAIMPERLASTDASTAVEEIVGSGPYRYLAEERVAGALNVYGKFVDYVPRAEAPVFTSGAKIAHFERVEWITMPDATSAAAALQSGEVDWWEQPTADLMPLFVDNPDYVVSPVDSYGLNMMLRLNHAQKPFDNPAVRRAIVHAVKQSDYLIAAMGTDPASRIENVGFFQPKSPMANEAGMENINAEPDFVAVKAELEAAGYSGERVVMLVPTDYPVLSAMSEVAADMMRQVGINLDYQAMDWGTQVQRLNSKEPVENGGWSIWANFASGGGAMNPVAHTYLRGNGEDAIWGWPDIPELEELRTAWIAAEDAAQQQEICTKMQEVAFREVPYVPLGIGLQPMVYRSDLTDALAGFPLFWNIRRA